jgi:hypothetical protein
MVPNNAAGVSFDLRGDTLWLTRTTRADGAPLRNSATLTFRRIESRVTSPIRVAAICAKIA